MWVDFVIFKIKGFEILILVLNGYVELRVFFDKGEKFWDFEH